MKRDMDLVRQLAMEIELLPHAVAVGESLAIDGYSTKQIIYHALLLLDAGLIVGTTDSPEATLDVTAYRLTWKGHDFVDAARDESIWNKVKSKIASKAESVAFDVFQKLLNAAAATALGLV